MMFSVTEETEKALAELKIQRAGPFVMLQPGQEFKRSYDSWPIEACSYCARIYAQNDTQCAGCGAPRLVRKRRYTCTASY